MAALNSLILPHHARSVSTSSSLSATSITPVYDNLYGANTPVTSAFPLGRPPAHGRNFSTASLGTQLTSPADSPPSAFSQSSNTNNLQYSTNAGATAFKQPISSATVARTNSFSSRRPRTSSSPYARTVDDYNNNSSSLNFHLSSRSSSSCSDGGGGATDTDGDMSMYFTNSSSSHLGGNGMSQQQQQSSPFSSNGVYGSGGGYGHGTMHPQQMSHHHSHVSPIDAPGSVVPSFNSMTLNPEAALENLAIQVRSSTTTTASDRAKQIFVQAWLTANYAPYPDGNVPRQGLYNSYRRVCDAYNIPHINTATLGKAIRLCFPNIKTRRLGVRGNSKYHYCGIRPVSVAEAEFLQDFVRRTTNHSAIAASSRRGAVAVAAANAARGGSSQSSGHGSDEDEDEDSEASASSYDAKEPIYNFTAGLQSSQHLQSGGFSHHGNAPSHINTLGAGTFPHPLTLGGGLKSPTLFSMDDKTPTTNTLLSMAQAQSLNGMGVGAGFGHGGAGGFGTAAQIRSRRGLGSMDSPSRPGTSGSGVSASSGSRLGAPGNFVSASPSPVGLPARMPVSVRTLPNFPSINEALGIDNSITVGGGGSERPGSAAGSPASAVDPPTSPQQMAALQVWTWFEDHLDSLLECVRTWRLDQFEMQVRSFWSQLDGDYREVAHAPAVAGLMVKADAIVYDEILETLRFYMLNQIPQHSLAALKQLAQKMEKILLVALGGYGNTFVEPKVELAARFGHLVLRFIDMFQVTQALSSVLSNHQQLADMRRAWLEVDFESVRNQSALVCNCRHDDLSQLLEVDFVNVLNGLVGNSMSGVRGTEPVKDIMAWADACCARLMGGNGSATAPGEERSQMSSRSILIRWGYVTSQVMRDLTIRSDPAFGAFQILKLFLDDWIALNVLRSVALSTNSVQASMDPIMLQQRQHSQYMALSPMTGQEFTGPGSSDTSHSDLGAAGLAASLMSQTPTTTSMLAALQNDAANVSPYDAPQHVQHPLAASFTYDAFNDPAAGFDMSFFATQSNGNSPMHHPPQHASPDVLGVAGDGLNTLSPARSVNGLDVPSGAVEELVRRESEEHGLESIVKRESDVVSLNGGN